MSFAVRTMAPQTVGASKAAALLESDGSVSQAYPIMRQLFLPAQRRALLSPDVCEAAREIEDPYVRFLTDALQDAPDSGLMSRVSYAESRTYMHDVLLRDADQMSMRQALEVRVPFLDHHLAQYLMALPDAVKLPGRTPKRLLRDSLPVPLPAVCTDRPKRGFVLPFDPWMRTSLGPFCARHLGPEGISGRRFLQPRAVEGLWQTFLDRGPATTWSRPWALVALNAWLEETGVDL
jgi:asparagine synthase (glutamine-hydrolysing)